ncbi:MAG: hypothetical protein QXL01_07745 [Thermoplasmatales archaeon]
MQDFLSLAEFIKNYASAIQTGFDKFVQASPVFAKQQIERLAKRKLNFTRDAYLEAVKVRLVNNVLVIELDRDSWIANAVESGVSGFNMKEGHLKSPKAKTSQKGFKYMVIPIGKQKDGSGGNTEKGQAFQAKVNQALANKKFGLTRLKAMVSGQIVQMQQVLSDDVDLSGFYRYRQFESAEAFHSGKKPQWQYVLFKAMSENPESKSKWEHPGIQPVHIFRDTERFLLENMPKMLDGLLEAEIQKLISRSQTMPRG